jgi:hypothetical protein
VAAQAGGAAAAEAAAASSRYQTMLQRSAGRPIPTVPRSENKEFRKACKARNPIEDETKAPVPGEGEEELSQARHKVSGGGQATRRCASCSSFLSTARIWRREGSGVALQRAAVCGRPDYAEAPCGRRLQDLRVDYRAEEDTCVKCFVRSMARELGGDTGGAEGGAA